MSLHLWFLRNSWTLGFLLPKCSCPRLVPSHVKFESLRCYFFSSFVRQIVSTQFAEIQLVYPCACVGAGSLLVSQTWLTLLSLIFVVKLSSRCSSGCACSTSQKNIVFVLYVFVLFRPVLSVWYWYLPESQCNVQRYQNCVETWKLKLLWGARPVFHNCSGPTAKNHLPPAHSDHSGRLLPVPGWPLSFRVSDLWSQCWWVPMWQSLDSMFSLEMDHLNRNFWMNSHLFVLQTFQN